jgi:hypothetical protein
MSERFDFDQLAREVANGLSRREALRRLGGVLVGAAVAALGLEGRAWGASKGGGDNNCGAACQATTGFTSKAPASVQSAYKNCVTACSACKDAGDFACIANGGTVACCSSGQSCISGACCGGTAAPCSGTAPCCAGLTCSGGTCQACLSDGNACTSSSDCCSGLCNSAQLCGCQSDGSDCLTSSDCCSAFCNSFAICGCVGNGGPCISNGDCCSAYCNSFDHCGCLGDGSNCLTDRDCCSGVCNSTLTCG